MTLRSRAVIRPVPWRENRLLASLPEDELRSLETHLEHVPLCSGDALCEPGEPVTHVYFPTAGIVSIVLVSDSGTNAELAVIGRDGMVGLPALLGGHANIRAMVQVAGHAWRLPAAVARGAFAEARHFQLLSLRSFHAYAVQISQTAMCNLHHSVDQQLSRWLLMCLDRLEGDEIQMTHEFIASMLGVRRQGVTEAMQKLEKRRIIAHSRGRITVVDRKALEQWACECYGMVSKQIDGLLSGAVEARGKRLGRSP
jgi:CRP-like cAMP-binding protein